MGYLTPNIIPESTVFRGYAIPDDPLIIAAFEGAIYELATPANWEEFGEITPDEISYKFLLIAEYPRIADMIGCIIPYATQETPAYLLPCNGDSYNGSEYPELYRVIDSDYKNVLAGTFTTPDMRDKFILSSGVRSLGDTGGTESETLTVDQIPAHNHTTVPHSHLYQSPTFNIDVESVGVPDPTGVGLPQFPVSTSSEGVTVNNTGGGLSHNNMPPYYVLRYGIVAR